MKGKVVVITGASGTVGRELAVELAREGAVLVLQCNTSEHVLRELASSGKLGGNAHVVSYDFSDVANAVRFAEYVKSRFGRVDVLVNAVGVYDDTDLEGLDYDTIARVLNVNLVSVVLISKELGLLMKSGGGGVIVNFSCLSALRGHRVYGCIRPSLPYVISKAGIIHLTRYLAHELAPSVRVVAIAPGWVRSSRLTRDLARCVEGSVPLGRPAEVDEVVRLVKFIICEGTYLNGAVVELGGGL